MGRPVHLPDRRGFAEMASRSSRVPVARLLLADAVTPVAAYARLAEGARHAFLFESVVGGEHVARYSFVGADPVSTYVWEGPGRGERAEGPGAPRPAGDPFRTLPHFLPEPSSAGPPGPIAMGGLPGLPRLTGGLVGFLGYDAVRVTESLPDPPPDPLRLPGAVFGLYDRVVVFDRWRSTVAAVATARTDAAGGVGAAYDAACAAADSLAERLREAPLVRTPDFAEPGPLSDVASDHPRAAFEAAVGRIREHIAAGDLFQAVLSRRLRVSPAPDPFALYRALRTVNPSPYMFLLRAGGLHLVGASPEVMVRVEDGRVLVRPIAGTRPRGARDDDDRRQEEELLADPKERAEHVMLLDLGRNDVGRVAEFGSVRVDERMVVERYSDVMHLVSQVSGRLRSGSTALDALRAALPAGTVTGAPKVRAMQILDGLEPVRRGPYAGAVGYLDFTGNLDTCLAIRTVVLPGDGAAYVQAGAGIVADSDPAREFAETEAKARGPLRAIALAREFGAEGAPKPARAVPPTRAE
ncbi:MAG: anthranilate synthase component I family protein [Planctomycetales bacterium]|nr:anthranilate synthase component I family protein [Planctomycetales bacterium]